MRKRLICLTLAVLLLLSPVAAAGRVSLFVGDKAYREDTLLPFLETENGDLLPVGAFAELSGLTVTLSESFGSLLLCYGEHFLSYDLEGGTKLDENGLPGAANIYRYGGEYYLAAEEVCEAFGLTFETDYDASGTRCARLTDGSETLTFAELRSYVSGTDTTAGGALLLRVPHIRTVQGTFLYPTILFPAAGDVSAILRAVGTHKCTFVFAPTDIEQYAAVLPAIYAGGHTVAYFLAPNRRGAESLARFTEEMQTANTLLFALVGKTSRLYVSTAEGTLPKIDGYYAKQCLAHLVDSDLSNEYTTASILSEAPKKGNYLFSVANDRDSRERYAAFWKLFDRYTELRAMPMTEAGATR